MDTLHSIENLPTEQTGSEELENEPEALNFRFMARNINIDWRSVSLIDIDRIAQTMDIPALQEHIELVTFAKMDDIFDIDPLFVKLFRIAQYTIEYLLHSQDYLKNTISNVEKKVSKEKEKSEKLKSEMGKLKRNVLDLKKENKKRRRIVEEQQRMMEVGANSFYKCPVCPNKTFMNASYLQGHLVRKHPEHVTYIGDAVAHTKIVTQKLESQLVTVEDRIELEKHRNEELRKKNEKEQEKKNREIEQKQEEIQIQERSRYENKLKMLEEEFNREVTHLKANETHYQSKIADLECKANFTEQKNSTIGNLVTEMQSEKTDYQNQFTARLSAMESALRDQQQRAEDIAVVKASRAQKPVQKMKPVVPDGRRKFEKPVRDNSAEKRAQLEQLTAQFRPAIEALFKAEMNKLGIRHEQSRLTDGMYKLKMEELRNNRSQKVGARPQFYDHRMKIEQELNRRSNTNIALPDATKNSPKKKKAPKRPTYPPAKKVPASTGLVQLRQPDVRPQTPPTRPETPPSNLKPTWSNMPDTSGISPGKPGFASTLKPQNNPPIESSVESSGWEAMDKKVESSKPKQMRTFEQPVVESVDVETITERTEPQTIGESSAWDSEETLRDEDSIGTDIKTKTQNIENQLSTRSGSKPSGGVDTTGADQTKMAIDDLLADTEAEMSERDP